MVAQNDEQDFRKEKSVKEKRTYGVIDVETSDIQDGEIPKTKFWGFADATGYKDFRTTDRMLKFLRTERKEMTLLHHAPFDIIQLLVDNAKLDILRSYNNKIIECRLGTHRTINTHSCFPVPLKKNKNHDKGIFEAFGYKGTGLDNLKKRNYEDCVFGLDCFLQLDSIFFDLVGVSPLERGTIAGTGFAAAEKIAGKMPKDLNFLDAYRGGKTECYDLRYYGKDFASFNQYFWNYTAENESFFPYDRIKSDVSKFDINSSYPFSFIDAPEKGTLFHLGVICHDWYAPFFDEFENDAHSLLFPNGKFTTWMYQDVLEKYVLPYAQKTKIKILSRHKIDLSWLKRLVDFVYDIYEKKNTSEGAIKLACKLLINATYGRIGLRGDGERAKFVNRLGDYDGSAAYKIGKRWLVYESFNREPRSNFPMAAYITDSARARLFAASVRNKALYTDTDSIVTLKTEKTFVGKTGDSLGGWKYEGTKRFRARNVKDYIWGDEEILKGGSGYMNWTLKRFAKGQSAESTTRTRKTELRKRIVNSDGTTNPLVVP